MILFFLIFYYLTIVLFQYYNQKNFWDKKKYHLSFFIRSNIRSYIYIYTSYITFYIFILIFYDSKTNYDSYLQNFGGGSVALNSVVAAAAVVDYTKT